MKARRRLAVAKAFGPWRPFGPNDESPQPAREPGWQTCCLLVSLELLNALGPELIALGADLNDGPALASRLAEMAVFEARLNKHS